jgi:hypothetical protein
VVGKIVTYVVSLISAFGAGLLGAFQMGAGTEEAVVAGATAAISYILGKQQQRPGEAVPK